MPNTHIDYILSCSNNKNMDKEEYQKLKLLKIECLEFAENNFRGNSYKNTSSGHEIRVSKKGLNEWFSKSKTIDQILSIKSLDTILTNANYSHSSENTKNLEQNAPSYEYYTYPILINNTNYTAIVTIRIIKEGTDDKYIYYHHYLDNLYIKKEPPSSIPRNPDTE